MSVRTTVKGKFLLKTTFSWWCYRSATITRIHPQCSRGSKVFFPRYSSWERSLQRSCLYLKLLNLIQLGNPSGWPAIEHPTTFFTFEWGNTRLQHIFWELLWSREPDPKPTLYTKRAKKIYFESCWGSAALLNPSQRGNGRKKVKKKNCGRAIHAVRVFVMLTAEAHCGPLSCWAPAERCVQDQRPPQSWGFCREKHVQSRQAEREINLSQLCPRRLHLWAGRTGWQSSGRSMYIASGYYHSDVWSQFFFSVRI